MRFDRSVVRVYGYSILVIVFLTAVASAGIISVFSDVPRIRYLIPILALLMGVLLTAGLAMVLYHAIQTRLSQTT